MYAATVWVWTQGGSRIAAIGRKEVRDLYLKVGMQPHGLEIHSGEVTFELMSAEIAELYKTWPRFTPILRKLAPRVDWQLDFPYFPPDACYHGGESFKAIGDAFDSLDRREIVINADVLDAWFPPSPGVLAALRESLEWLARTSPPTHSEGLIRTVAAVRGVPEASLLAGAGSSSLIYQVLREWLTRDSRTLTLDPSYGEYTHLFEKVIGCRSDLHALDPARGYLPHIASLAEHIQQGYDLVVLVNPNSPTGRYVPRQELETLLLDAPARTRFWIDETYLDYVGADLSLEGFAAKSSNVVVCKSLSKVYALSGLRSAYLCGPAALIQPLRAINPPWAVGLPSQVAAVMALNDTEYYTGRYRETHLLRESLRASLLDLGMASVVPGVANFLMAHLQDDGPDTETLLSRCRDFGLYLRNPAVTSPRLGARTVRIAVKDGATNSRMIEILRQCLLP